MVPLTPPLIWRLILSPEACPTAVPVALKVRSSQVPVMRPAALAELAPDLDVGAFALAANGHAELRAAAGVVSVALQALLLPVGHGDLPAAAPGAEKDVERIGGGLTGRPRG